MMSSVGENWIRIFDIPSTNKHRKGFTIYKIVSMLYPVTCPDAITKITVWKRFNDFKKLHREMKVLHMKLNIRDKYPSLPTSTFFQRFDEGIVQERKENILRFLDYIGAHYQLFTSNEFVKFFESSHTPADQLASNISSIRADLNLPEDPEYLLVNSDDEHTTSDTDSIASPNSQATDLASYSKSLSKSKLSLNTSHHSRNSDSLSISTTADSLLLADGQLYPTPPHTPGVSETNTTQYIIDASMHVNMAVELENEKKYEEAFAVYKTAIDILLRYGKEDKNYDRRQMVRYRTEKYLIRAEKIYNMHLSSEIRSLKELEQNSEDKKYNEHFPQRPISELYKYKVVRVISSGMLVLHSELQQIFFIKVIHKTVKFFNDNLILPEHVPYMVKLHNYYNCENALFLVLEYCSGKKLSDYIKFCSDSDKVFSEDQVLRLVEDIDISDAESEHSYSELINEYTNNKSKISQSSSDESFERISIEGSRHKNLMDEPVPQHISLTSKILPSNEELASSQRKSSHMSVDDVDCERDLHIPLQDVVKWSAQLLLALEKLHSLGVVCCDIRSDNLLINEDGDLILTYMCNVYELCDIFSNGKSLNLAPEIYSFQPITQAVDWWCFGVILYELLVGIPLVSIHAQGLTRYTTLKIPKYVSAEGKSLLKQLLTFEPHERLGYGTNGTEALKSHPFYSSVSWDILLSKYNVYC